VHHRGPRRPHRLGAAEGANWWSERLRFLNPTEERIMAGEKLYKALWMLR
jgi:hypothetical protein